MEETIYDKCLERVRQGADFKVDFIKRSVMVDGKYVIKEGKYEGTLFHYNFDKDDVDGAMEVIREQYNLYRVSRPTKKSMAKRHVYFEAMSQEELDARGTAFAWFTGKRDESQFSLEFIFLGFVLLGVLKWNPQWGSYYYKDPNSPLRIQREWIEER